MIGPFFWALGILQQWQMAVAKQTSHWHGVHQTQQSQQNAMKVQPLILHLRNLRAGTERTSMADLALAVMICVLIYSLR